jgi:hypothetical protein
MNLVDYLSNGALINILQTNSGPNPPRVWISAQPDGSYRFGFAKLSDGVGGHAAPFGAVQSGKIFRAMETDVVEFLRTFGLSKAGAESVVQRIGVEP